ncbi:MAG: hypothetical protein P9L88_04970 [Candidatus Tantalella remota]|nr:hypothetical protein [Candidatus Tantalella remota]
MMKTFFVEFMGIICRMNLVNFHDEIADRFSFEISPDKNIDMEIFFLRGQTGTMSPELLKKLKKPFYEIFDEGERKTFCIYEGDVSVEFLTEYELNRSFLEFQNELDLIFVHCAAVLIRGRAYLYIAPSGGGKSTIAGMLSEYDDAEVIDDESSVLRRIDGEYYVHRYPVGLAKGSDPDMCAVAGVYFLEKSDDNYLRDLSPVEAIKHTLPEACGLYPDNADKEYIALCRKRTFDFLSEMYNHIDVKLLGFNKNSEIRECLKIS